MRVLLPLAEVENGDGDECENLHDGNKQNHPANSVAESVESEAKVFRDEKRQRYLHGLLVLNHSNERTAHGKRRTVADLRHDERLSCVRQREDAEQPNPTTRELGIRQDKSTENQQQAEREPLINTSSAHIRCASCEQVGDREIHKAD